MGDRLGPEELEAAGRAAIAGLVREARGAGLDAWGWLPNDADREGLMAYAARQPGAHVMVPRGDEHLSLEDLPEAEVVANPSA